MIKKTGLNFFDTRPELDYQQLFEQAPSAYLLLDGCGLILAANRAAARLFDSTIPTLQERSFHDFLLCHDEWQEQFSTLMQHHGNIDEEFALLRQDGTVFFARLQGGYNNDMLHLLIHDVSLQKQQDSLLQTAAIAFESQDGILITDLYGTILRVNHAFSKITGYSESELAGKSASMLNSGRHGKDFFDAMWMALKQQRHWQGEIWNRRKNGRIYAEWLSISAVTNEHNEITHYVGTFSNITHDSEASAEIHRLAYYDTLTQLPNRRLMKERLVQALHNSQRAGRYGALLTLDLDQFKKLNDLRGHDAGDKLLVQIAKRLNACVREEHSLLRASDTVARLGGDEFAVLLEGLAIDELDATIQAGQIAEKIHKTLAVPHMLDGAEFAGSASIGACIFLGQMESIDNLFKYSDLAMHHAKKTGRNRTCFFDPAMQTALMEHSAVEQDLRYALSRQQLRLHYQLQINQTGRVIGAEALLRWYHHSRGVVYPDEFIPLAEESGLIIPIGMWVMQQVCLQLKAWSQKPLTCNLQLSVNVSPRQFHQNDFVEQVRAIIEHSAINPALLKIELTESSVLSDIDDTIQKMHALKALGISFSMDDFGTGYSSLSNLQQLPFNQLKIDQSFVRDLATNPNDVAIVQAIVTMGHAFGLNVIAEGVETELQRQLLNTYGCHAFQGYLFNKPVPIAKFEQILQRYV